MPNTVQLSPKPPTVKPFFLATESISALDVACYFGISTRYGFGPFGKGLVSEQWSMATIVPQNKCTEDLYSPALSTL
jgi:hypothetical protein